MTVPSTLKYPPEATNAAWQKKKSFLDKAKAKTKTGLGEELIRLQAKWNGVKFDKLDAKKVGLEMGASSNAVEAKKHLAEVELQKVATLQQAVDSAAKKAKAVAAIKGLSKDAAAAANVISTKLTTLDNDLGKIDLKDFDVAIKNAKEQEATNDKYLKESITTLTQALSDLRRTPTLVRWEQRDLQSIDMIRRIVSGDVRYAQHKDSWKDLRSDMQNDIPVLLVPGAKRDKEQEKEAILQLVQRVSTGLSALK